MEGSSSNGCPTWKQSGDGASTDSRDSQSSCRVYRLMPTPRATLCFVLTLSHFLESWTGSFPWCLTSLLESPFHEAGTLSACSLLNLSTWKEGSAGR